MGGELTVVVSNETGEEDLITAGCRDSVGDVIRDWDGDFRSPGDVTRYGDFIPDGEITRDEALTSKGDVTRGDSEAT